MRKLKDDEYCMIQWEAKRLPTPKEAIDYAISQFVSGYGRNPSLVLVNKALLCEHPDVEVKEGKIASKIVYYIR